MPNASPYGAEIPASELSVKRELIVKLSAAGNIDRGEDPDSPLYGVPNGSKAVVSLAEASKACRQYIDEHGLGGGQWTGGDVLTKDGALVARVSYNGRIWAVTNPESSRRTRKPSIGPSM